MPTDQVVISSGPTGPDAPAPEDNQSNTQNQDNQRPAWLPEKFKTPEDFAKAYGELEKQFTQNRQNQNNNPPQNTPQDASERVMVGDLDVTKYNAEFAEKGELSEASYAELAKQGLTRETVDAYIEGQRSIGETYFNNVTSVVGGQENYASMIQWAQANLNEAEKAAFNRVVDGPDIEQTKLAVAGLWSKFTSVNGKPPQSLIAGGGQVINGQGYRSSDEMIRAMSDPRYRTDEAYRKDVAGRIMRSNF